MRGHATLGSGTYSQVWSTQAMFDLHADLMRRRWQVEVGVEIEAAPSKRKTFYPGHSVQYCFVLKRHVYDDPRVFDEELSGMRRVRAAMLQFDRMHLTPILTPMRTLHVRYTHPDPRYPSMVESMVLLRQMDSTASHELRRRLGFKDPSAFRVGLASCTASFLGFCDALHACDLVHHDAKLENMLFRMRGRTCVPSATEDEYVVSDYGTVIARKDVQYMDDGPRGSPLYFSPVLTYAPNVWHAEPDEREALWERLGTIRGRRIYDTIMDAVEARHGGGSTAGDVQRTWFRHVDFHAMGLSILNELWSMSPRRSTRNSQSAYFPPRDPFALEVARVLLVPSSRFEEEDAHDKLKRLRRLLVTRNADVFDSCIRKIDGFVGSVARHPAGATRHPPAGATRHPPAGATRPKQTRAVVTRPAWV